MGQNVNKAYFSNLVVGVLLITLRTLTLKNFRITHLMNAEKLAKYYTTRNKIKIGESIFM